MPQEGVAPRGASGFGGWGQGNQKPGSGKGEAERGEACWLWNDWCGYADKPSAPRSGFLLEPCWVTCSARAVSWGCPQRCHILEAGAPCCGGAAEPLQEVSRTLAWAAVDARKPNRIVLYPCLAYSAYKIPVPDPIGPIGTAWSLYHCHQKICAPMRIEAPPRPRQADPMDPFNPGW